MLIITYTPAEALRFVLLLAALGVCGWVTFVCVEIARAAHRARAHKEGLV